MKTTTSSTKHHTPTPAHTHNENFAFGRENYTIMLIGLAVIVLGFVLMCGGKSDDPNVFNPDVFSFRRITLAPIVVLIGFGIEFYAIIKKSKE